jgi:biopolymer transport protein ExbB
LGWLFYPLLLCSLIALTIILERSVFFLSVKSVSLNTAPEEIKPSNRIIFYLVSELEAIKQFPKESREEMMGIALGIIKRQLNTGSGMLKFIGAIAPMLGLLGNVLGMLHSFTAIAASKSGINPIVVSAGLKEAMYVTSFGLGIAVPAMFSEYFIKYLASSRFDNYVAYVTQMNLILDEKSKRKVSGKKPKAEPQLQAEEEE